MAHAQILFLVVDKTCSAFLNSQRAASIASVLCLSPTAQEGKRKRKELYEQGRVFVSQERVSHTAPEKPSLPREEPSAKYTGDFP